MIAKALAMLGLAMMLAIWIFAICAVALTIFEDIKKGK